MVGQIQHSVQYKMINIAFSHFPMADGLESAKTWAFNFTFAKSEKNKGSHYSTLKTMKEVSYLHKLSTI